MKYCIVVKNTHGDNIKIFEQNQFNEAISYMEKGGLLVSAYRIQLVEKG
jgi:hypothetical protein